MKHHLYAGTAICLMLVGGTAQAQAQARTVTGPEEGSAAPAQPAGEGGDIVVTGVRRANNVAIRAKREATNIVDAIGATDVRALPDATIVEALQRIPGISVIPATDNEHPRDEAATPVIRGLGPNYNNVTVDGLQLASPGTPNGTLGSITRGVRLDILPSSMISQLQVVKTFTPDLDPNAVGGAINIVTRSAFEGGGKPFFTGEASLGHSSDTGLPAKQPDFGTRISGTASTTFGADHQFGLVLSGNYQTLHSYTDTHMTTDGVHYNFYNDAGARKSGTNLGNGIAVPQQDKYWYVQSKRDRSGLTGKFEARISDTLTSYLSLGYYYFKDAIDRNELLIDPRTTTTVQRQTPTSGFYPVGDIEVGYAHSDVVTRTALAQAGIDWHPDDRQQLSARFGASRATYDEQFQMIKYITGTNRPAPGIAGPSITPTSDYAISYDTSGLNHSFNVNPAAFYNLQNYGLYYYRPFNRRRAENEVLTGRIDYAWNRGRDADGVGFAIGGSYADDRPSFNLDRIDLSPNTGGARTLTLATALGPTGAPLRYSNGLYLLTVDPTKALRDIGTLPTTAFNSTNQANYNNQDDFEHVEKIAGAYALAGYRSDAFTAEAGLRLDHTDQDTTGRLRTNAGAFRPQTTSSKYTYVLPSVIATWHATPKIDLRFGASQTIGRPAYDSYAARTSIGFRNAQDEGNPNATDVSVTIGNPDIKPRRSTNIDVAFDYELSSRYGGILSLAAFYKDIRDEIFNVGSTGFAFNGVTYANALVSQPDNASKAGIKGVEANAVINSLGFVDPLLKGFGFSANASYLDGFIDVPVGTSGAVRRTDRLVGQPDYIANASLFYSEGGLELRAAYVRKGRALRSIVTNTPWQDLYWAPRQQVDLSASYTLTNGVAIVGQVANVTHERLTSLTGPGRNLLKDSYSVPTTFWLGVRFTPRF